MSPRGEPIGPLVETAWLSDPHDLLRRARGLSPELADRLVAWQRLEGRHHLPWQQAREPYRVWLSEIMLQQTQVSMVLGYFDRFLARFPSVVHLADAELDEVLSMWSGLGYYSRARNLHRCAQTVRDEHGGHFPESAHALEQLPGIGPSTAAAIAAFCFGERVSMAGPRMRVNSQMAQNLAMAVHELATNATKYGALSVPEGLVRIRWRVHRGPSGDPLFAFVWEESGGPPPPRDPKDGFGRVLLRRLIGSAIGGEPEIEHLPTGLRYAFECPLERIGETVFDGAGVRR